MPEEPAGKERCMNLSVGDIVKMKKQHPCGSREWELLRVGMDLKMKCMGCGHQVMLARSQAEKNIRAVVPAAERETQAEE